MPSGTRAVLAFLAWLAASAAWAQTDAAAPSHPDEDCLVCHGDASAARASGEPVFVDAARFAASVHGQLQMACVDCHADVATVELPHAEELAPVDCSSCHTDAVTQFRASVHAKAEAAGRAGAATCASCHGVHDILPSKDPASRTNHFNLAATCGSCHGTAAMVGRGEGHADVVRDFQDSIHGRALSRGGLVVAPSCASCHGSHLILAPGDPQSRVARANVPSTCGTCHEGIERQYTGGQHGHALQGDNPRAPVCSDCHAAHGVQRADAARWQLGIIQQCGTCHREALSTYRDTFHGQVTALGYTPVAKCADCHGAHRVLPASSPASPIHPSNRVATCRQCHPGANDNFAQYDPHADRHDKASGATLYYAGLFMDVLLAGVFGFFGIHSTLWLARSYGVVRERRRRGRGGAPAAPRRRQEDREPPPPEADTPSGGSGTQTAS